MKDFKIGDIVKIKRYFSVMEVSKEDLAIVCKIDRNKDIAVLPLKTKHVWRNKQTVFFPHWLELISINNIDLNMIELLYL